jgi:hypothetical protein
LACRAEVSARHLSFIETGRSRPTRDMIIKLADQLDVPLRERNTLLLAAGHAPAYPVGDLEGPELCTVVSALRGVLTGHDPYPALLVDRHWTLVDANPAVALLTGGVAAELLVAPVNVLRLSLHPDGMAPNIVNLAQWRAHVLHRLHRQAAATGDAELLKLHDELAGYPGGEPEGAVEGLAVPLRYRLDGHELCFVSFTAVLGTPLDVTLAELAVEAFLPADPATAELLHARRSSR